MLVQRSIIHVKPLKYIELVEILQKMKPYFAERGIPFRIYTAYYGEYGDVIMETEHDSFADIEKLNKEFWDDPLIAPLIPKIVELAVKGRTGELLVLH